MKMGVGRGPIEEAFGSPVLIVEGTLGTSAQHSVVHELVKELQDEWRKAYFVDCPIRMDTDISDSDIRNYNLIIVGDDATNSIAKRFGTHSPLRTTGQGISLAAKTYEGTHLGYEFIIPNPLNPAKDAIVIGMSQWQSVRRWGLHPSRDGICDYFVFDLHGTAARLKDAGYFDESFWQVSTPVGN
jgi:hypothetical protein